MTDLITADWHLSDNPRDEYRWALFPKLHKLIAEKSINRVIVLGDLTEQKDNHSATLVNKLIAGVLSLLAAGAKQIIILTGNHDGTTSDNPFFRFMHAFEGIIWITQPGWHDHYLFLPYTLDYQKDWKDIVSGTFTNEIIFCHQMFSGTHLNGRVLGGIPLTVFPDGSKIISGDIHEAQEYRVGKRILTYVGAPYTIDFGDNYYGGVLFLNKGRVSARLLHMPQKRLIEVSLDGKGDNINAYKGDIVRIRLAISSDNYGEWPAYRDCWRKWGEDSGLVVHAIEPVIVGPAKIGKAMQGVGKRSDKEILETYAKAAQVSPETLDKGLMML